MRSTAQFSAFFSNLPQVMDNNFAIGNFLISNIVLILGKSPFPPRYAANWQPTENIKRPSPGYEERFNCGILVLHHWSTDIWHDNDYVGGQIPFSVRRLDGWSMVNVRNLPFCSTLFTLTPVCISVLWQIHDFIVCHKPPLTSFKNYNIDQS